MTLRVRLMTALYKLSRDWLNKHANVPHEMAVRAKERRKNVNGFRVTEHALIRYFERVEGYDLDKVRLLLASDRLKERAKTTPVGRIEVGDLTVVVDGKWILTVYKTVDRSGNHIRGFARMGRES